MDNRSMAALQETPRWLDPGEAEDRALEIIEGLPYIPAKISRERFPKKEFRLRCLGLWELKNQRRPTTEEWVALTGVSPSTARKDLKAEEGQTAQDMAQRLMTAAAAGRLDKVISKT